MKRFTLLAPLALLSVAPMAANALTISPDDATDMEACGTAVCLAASGPETSQAAINAIIAGLLGTSTLQYTQNVGGSEEGPFAGSYTTTFSNSALDPEDALIDYVGGAVLNATHLLVKDGNSTPAWYLFNIAGAWNGTDDLILENFWVGGGAISHISLYGGGTVNVPEPATIGLLGAGLLAFGLMRRRKAA